MLRHILHMITAAQIRAARAMLDITIDRLSQDSGVAALLILQIEAGSGYEATPANYAALRLALERHGLLFLAAGEAGAGGEGLRLAAAGHQEGMHPEELNSTNTD
jgi:transcriptional regulator with XRE-family HTH domain